MMMDIKCRRNWYVEPSLSGNEGLNHDKYLLHARFLQTFIFWINYGKADIIDHLPSIEFEWTYEAKHDL